MACKIGAARELFEETGMDLRNSLERLNPIQVQKHGHDTGDKLSCQFKKRVFFSVDITDDDLFTTVCIEHLPYLHWYVEAGTFYTKMTILSFRVWA